MSKTSNTLAVVLDKIAGVGSERGGRVGGTRKRSKKRASCIQENVLSNSTRTTKCSVKNKKTTHQKEGEVRTRPYLHPQNCNGKYIRKPPSPENMSL